LRRLEALAAAALLLAGPCGAAAAERDAPLRLGVVTFYNPRLMYLKYQPLVDYLSARTGARWELAISGSYESTVESLCSGAIALAYLGPLTYVRARELCGATPVVKLLTNGQPTFRSFIVVREDGPIKSLADLRGRSFGFGSPLSTSSHIVPRATLARAGLRPGVDVRCRYYRHHDSAARAVLLGEVDAAGVRDIVAEEFAGRGLRILDRSEAVPNFPFVVAPKVSAKVVRDVVRALVTIPAVDGEARATIARWDEELAGGFARASADEFEPLGRLGEQVFGKGWTTLPERALECDGGER
jgi:phosphonate transport system substrate-binding protein